MADYKSKLEEKLSKYDDYSKKNLGRAVVSSTLRNPMTMYSMAKFVWLENKSQALNKRVKSLLEPELKIESEKNKKRLDKILKYVYGCNAIQVLLGVDMDIPDSAIFVIILYPLTDDIIDDPNINLSIKQQFAKDMERFIESEGQTSFSFTNLGAEHDDALKLIPIYIKKFFASIRNYPSTRKQTIKHELKELNKAQNASAIIQACDFYSGKELNNPCKPPDFYEIYNLTRKKGGQTFILFAYLLAPLQIATGNHEVMHRIGEVYQLADDISDVMQDTVEKIITPPAMTLLIPKTYAYTQSVPVMPIRPPYLLTTKGNALTKEGSTLRKKQIELEEQTPEKLGKKFLTDHSYFCDANYEEFYKYCYDTVDLIESLFQHEKALQSGIKWYLLEAIQILMISYIRKGFNLVKISDLR